jgi:hypothetical protein
MTNAIEFGAVGSWPLHPLCFSAQLQAAAGFASHYARTGTPCQVAGRPRPELVERLALNDVSICVEGDGPSG